jgi:hypothetical protein
MSNMVTHLISNTYILVMRYVVKCGSKNGYQEYMYLLEYCIACSKYDNHSRLTSKHSCVGGGDMYDHLMSTGKFTLTMNKIFIRAP